MSSSIPYALIYNNCSYIISYIHNLCIWCWIHWPLPHIHLRPCIIDSIFQIEKNPYEFVAELWAGAWLIHYIKAYYFSNIEYISYKRLLQLHVEQLLCKEQLCSLKLRRLVSILANKTLKTEFSLHIQLLTRK